MPHGKKVPGVGTRRGFSPLVLRLPPSVQTHAREVNWSLYIAHKCECECEWLFVLYVTPVMNWQLVQHVRCYLNVCA